jgi:hypothetical protein
MRLRICTIGFVKDCEGKGTLGCLFTIAVAAGIILVVAQAGPPYIAYKNLQGDVNLEVSRAGARYFSDTVLVQNILDVAKRNSVPLKRENVRVERNGQQLQVFINYTVPVNFVVVRRIFSFEIKASSFLGTL